MYRAIMVPLDGSSFGEYALPLALSLARSAGALLHLVHVHVAVAPLFVDAMPALEDTLDTENCAGERAYLEGLAQRLAPNGKIAITTSLLDARVVDALHAYTAAQRIDLVVMSTHGRGALSRVWLGSVADRLVRCARVPVLLVRPQETAPELAPVPLLKHLLIPLDESALADQALAHAVVLGTLTEAEYTLLYVVEPVIGGYGMEPYGAAIDEQVLSQARAHAQSYLERVAVRLRSEALRVQTAVVLGLPAQTILDYSRTHAVDAIAMASHGRSGTARLLLGSVADKVVRGASVPVLLCRPHGAGGPPAGRDRLGQLRRLGGTDAARRPRAYDPPGKGDDQHPRGGDHQWRAAVPARRSQRSAGRRRGAAHTGGWRRGTLSRHQPPMAGADL
jgi:nucleotide-binding universal stress UspA family protein